jgi:WD40 repeat protein
VCNAPPFRYTVALYDLSAGTLIDFGQAHYDAIGSVALSRDGSRIATGSSDKGVVLWDVKSRTRERVCETDFTVVSSLAFAPDSQTLFASSWDGKIRSWDLRQPTEPNVLAGHSAAVNALALSPDGRWLASAGQDGTGRLWNLAETGAFATLSPAEFTTLLHPADAFSPAAGPSAVWSLAVAPNQQRVAVVTLDKLFLWDLQTGARVTEVTATSIFGLESVDFRSITFSPDGRLLAVGGDNGLAAFLDGTTLQSLGQPIQLRHSQFITDIAFALHGAVLATGGGLGTGITLTDVASQRIITNFQAVEGFNPMQPLAVSPDGQRLATGGPEGAIRLWDIASQRLLATSPEEVRSPFCMAFSPDGRLLAFADTFGPVYLWDTSGRRPLRRLTGHNGAATALAFAPDGMLASGGMDHTIRLWRLDIDQEVAILEGHRGWVMCLAFAEDGNTLLSGSMDGTLNLWRATPVEEIEAAEKVSQTNP